MKNDFDINSKYVNETVQQTKKQLKRFKRTKLASTIIACSLLGSAAFMCARVANGNIEKENANTFCELAIYDCVMAGINYGMAELLLEPKIRFYQNSIEIIEHCQQLDRIKKKDPDSDEMEK